MTSLWLYVLQSYFIAALLHVSYSTLYLFLPHFLLSLLSSCPAAKYIFLRIIEKWNHFLVESSMSECWLVFSVTLMMMIFSHWPITTSYSWQWSGTRWWSWTLCLIDFIDKSIRGKWGTEKMMISHIFERRWCSTQTLQLEGEMQEK